MKHGKIALAIMGKAPSAMPGMHDEPDGDEPMTKPEGLDATMEKLSQMSPEALVNLIATIATEKPEVLAAIKAELGEGGDGMGASPMPASNERAY